MGDGCVLFEIGTGGRVCRNFFTCRTHRGLDLGFLGGRNRRSTKGEGSLREQTQTLFVVDMRTTPYSPS